MAASPSFRFAAQAAGAKYSATAGATVSASLISTDGVSSVSWTVAGTDETRTTSSYTLTPSGSVGQSVSFTAGVAGTAVILKATINGGVNPRTGNVDATMSATGKAFVPTATGVEVIAAGESFESSSTHGWAAAMNPALRLAGSGTAGVSAVAGSGRITSTGGANPTVSSAALEILGDNELTSAVDLSDATGSITVAAGKRRSVPAITAAREYTLSTSGATAGDVISVHRPASRRFPATLINGGAGGDRWGAKTAGLYAFRFDGTNWAQISAPASNGAVHLNVRDFGALGDGTTDDTAAIQACMAAVPDGGGEVYFPPGQYLTSGNITISRSGTKVYGACKRISQIYAPGNWTALPLPSSLIFIMSASSNGTDGVEIHDIEIAHLGFWGAGDIAEANTPKGICGSFVFGLNLHDCHFEHFGRETIKSSGGSYKISERWSVINNSFKDCGHDGLGGLGAPSCVNMEMHRSVVSGNHLDSCYMAIGVGHCDHVSIANNVIINPIIYGITVGDALGTTNISITGNTVSGLVPNLPVRITSPPEDAQEPNGLACITVRNSACNNISISGNSLEVKLQAGCAYHGKCILIAGGTAIAVVGNSCLIDCDSVALPSTGILVEPNSTTDLTIVGNNVRFVDAVSSGFVTQGIAAGCLTQTLRTVVVGNRVYGLAAANSDYAYAFAETGGGTHKCVFQGNSQDGDAYVAVVGDAGAVVGVPNVSISGSNVCSSTHGARARTPSALQSITAAGNSITASLAELVLVSNSTGGSITLTSTPTIANGYNGQTVTVMNMGTQDVVLQDQGTLASSNLRLTATTITLGPRDSVQLTYLTAYADWFQTGPVVAVL